VRVIWRRSYKKSLLSDKNSGLFMFYPTVVCSFLLGFVFSGLAAADTEKTSDDFLNLTLEELLNTQVEVGSFFSEKIEDVGSTVSFVGREEWRARGAKTVTQAISHLPSVHQNTHGDLENIVIRGYQRSNSYSGVLLLVDNIPLNDYTFSSGTQRVGLLDSYSQMEVIKGPGSTLYGSDAFSGLLAMKTWDSEVDITESGIEYGSYGQYGATFKHAQNLNDNVRVSLNVVTQGQDDMDLDYDYYGLDDQLGKETQENHRDVNSIIAKFNYKETQLMLYKHHLATRNVGYGFNFVSDVLATSNGNLINRHTDMDLYSLTHAQLLGNNGKIIFKSYKWESESFSDYGIEPGPIAEGGSVNIDQQDIRSGQDIKYLYNSSTDSFKFVAGLSYEELETGDQSSFGQPPESVLISDQKRIVKSGLFNADYTFLDGKYKVIAGGRFDSFNDIDENHFSPRLGLNYYFDSTNTFKLLYGNSFRAPNVTEINGTAGASNGGGETLKPESTDTLELIHMYKKQNFSLASTTFFSVFEDLITLSEDSPPTYINVEDSEAWGIELEAKYLLGKFDYYASVSYTDSWATAPKKDHAIYDGFPDWLINYGLRYRASHKPFDIAIYNSHRYGAKTLAKANFTNVPLGESVSPYVRTDVITTYYLGGRNSNQSIYLNIQNLFDRDNYISGNLASYEGNKDSGINAVVGFRLSY
jgi:iron complex outermembrane receptor protein